MHPSTAFRMNTDFHSCPFAEWMVEDEVVLVEMRHAGFAARGVRRIERELRQKWFAGAAAAGDLAELHFASTYAPKS